MADDDLIEMLIDGTWTNVTTDVKIEQPITVERGKSELAKQAGPAKLGLTLRNVAGKYSPRNPLGPYFGKIGRNTQIRYAKMTDAHFDAYSNSSGTGDLAWTHTPAGTPTGVCVFIWQYSSNTGQINSVTYGGVAMERKTFGLFTLQGVQAVGYMYFLNHNIPAGAQTVAVDTNSTILRQSSAVSFVGGDTCEIDSNTWGSSGATPSANPVIGITVFKRACIVGSLLSDLNDGSTIATTPGYAQLGEHDIGTETVSVMVSGPTSPNSYGVDWTASSAGWGIMATAVRAVYYRFLGEISELPPRTDLSHEIAYVPIQAASLLRRLQQGSQPAQIGLREFILSNPQSLTSYWPLSGDEGTQYSENLGKTWEKDALTRFVGVNGPLFKYGVDLGGAIGSVLELDTGPVPDGSYMFGGVGTSEQSGVAVDFVWQAAVMGSLQMTVEDYQVNRWSVTLNNELSEATAFVTFDDPDVGPIAFAETAALGALRDNKLHHCRLQLTVDGADTDYELFIDGVSVKTGTMSGYTWDGTACVYFRYVKYPGTPQTVMNLGHVTVWSENDPANIPSVVDVSDAAHGYTGETAGERMERVAALAAVPLTIVGDVVQTTLMGVQFAEPTLAQIRDAESTDLGMLIESRNALELRYRTRVSLYNQAPTLTIDYSAHQVAEPFEPVDDDAGIRNDVTAKRRGGDSYRLTKTTGALSTAAPPDGVGPYEDEIQANVEQEGMLPSLAAWFLNLGTLDQLRFPTLTVNLAAPDAAALKNAVLATDIGDLIRVTNLQEIGIYDDLDLIVVGYNEVCGPVVHTWTANLMTAVLYSPAEYASSAAVGTARFDAYDSKLAAGVSSSATTLSVTSTEVAWTNDPDAFPFDIMVSGERMTVTNITGTTSPQSFTVTRAVNGVTKAQLVDAEVHVYPLSRFAL